VNKSIFSIILAVVLALLASVRAAAIGGSESKSGPTETIAELTRLSIAWDAAIVRKDTIEIADNMTADFREISSNGELANKNDFVQGVTSNGLTIDPYTVEEFDVRLYGDVALLSGQTHMTGHAGGKSFTTHYRYIDIYRRIDGKWKVCSVQTTRISG
jgi:ketosteroid isomerase-like protein